MTEAAIVKHEGNGVAIPNFNREQIDLIKATVCPADTTDNELKLFLHVARVSGLDPLRRQIHCTKRQGKLTLIAGIDGLRARAAREADFEGILHGVVCMKDVLEFDAATGAVVKHSHNPFAERGPIVGAWATVRRRGHLPFTAMAKFSEFAQPASPTWKQMPAVMIDKVAQSTALRMAYPEQFSAIYEQAEMDQAEPPPVVIGAATEALKAKLSSLPNPSPPRVSRMPIIDNAPPPEAMHGASDGMGGSDYDPPPHGDEDMGPEAPAYGETIPPEGAHHVDPPMRFGSGANAPLASLDAKSLAWYAKCLAENVADPAKARFKESNQEALNSILREQKRR